MEYIFLTHARAAGPDEIIQMQTRTLVVLSRKYNIMLRKFTQINCNLFCQVHFPIIYDN